MDTFLGNNKFLRWLKKVGIFLLSIMVGPLLQYFSQLSAGRRFRSNVLSHLVWIGLLILPAGFYGLFAVTDTIVRVFCGLMIAAYLFYNVLKYEYWQKNDPDRLQSEWLTVKKLEATMATKGEHPKPIDVSKVVTPPESLLEDKAGE